MDLFVEFGPVGSHGCQPGASHGRLAGWLAPGWLAGLGWLAVWLAGGLARYTRWGNAIACPYLNESMCHVWLQELHFTELLGICTAYCIVCTCIKDISARDSDTAVSDTAVHESILAHEAEIASCLASAYDGFRLQICCTRKSLWFWRPN